eukprot:276079-Chlamydomonas_euryale.AAC.1
MRCTPHFLPPHHSVTIAVTSAFLDLTAFTSSSPKYDHCNDTLPPLTHAHAQTHARIGSPSPLPYSMAGLRLPLPCTMDGSHLPLP